MMTSEKLRRGIDSKSLIKMSEREFQYWIECLIGNEKSFIDEIGRILYE